MYTPYPFAMDPNPGINKFTESHKRDLDYHFGRLYNKFIAKGIPVYIGEMGATNKENLEEREAWFGYFVGKAWEKNIPAVLWDNGAYNASSKNYSEKYGFYCRTQAKWYFPSLIRISVNGAGGKAGEIPAFASKSGFTFNDKKAQVLLEKFDTNCWNTSKIISKSLLAKLKEGSVIKITTEKSVSADKNYRLLSFRDSSWRDLESFTGDLNGDASFSANGIIPEKDKTVIYWVLSKEDADILKKQDILLCGNNVNISGIYVQY